MINIRLSEQTTWILDALGAMGNNVEVIDRRGYYVYCSNNCNYDFFSAGEMIGKHATEVYDMSDESSVLLTMLRTGIPQTNLKMAYTSRRTGITHHWLYECFPLICKGRIMGAIAIYRPMSSSEYNDTNGQRDFWQVNAADAGQPTYLRGSAPSQKPSDGLFRFDDIIHASESMTAAIRLARKVAKSDSAVLVVGETGTGKELFAQSIHTGSRRAGQKFVAINCAAIPETLLESTLFGVTKGAYTGAIDKKGLFEAASGGTLFLDEVQSLSPEMQAKLLRVLETKTVRRVGSETETPIDTRIVTAMNKDPMECIRAGVLKADFFYRIAVVTIEIPPLRERTQGIEILTNYFLNNIVEKLNKQIDGCTQEVMDLLNAYQWPGNVRELQHVLEHAANMMADDETYIRVSDLPGYIRNQSDKRLACECNQGTVKRYEISDYKTVRKIELDKWSEEFNKTFLTQALEECDWNVSHTAQTLNISRQHLYELMSKYDIDD